MLFKKFMARMGQCRKICFLNKVGILGILNKIVPLLFWKENSFYACWQHLLKNLNCILFPSTICNTIFFIFLVLSFILNCFSLTPFTCKYATLAEVVWLLWWADGQHVDGQTQRYSLDRALWWPGSAPLSSLVEPVILMSGWTGTSGTCSPHTTHIGPVRYSKAIIEHC